MTSCITYLFCGLFCSLIGHPVVIIFRFVSSILSITFENFLRSLLLPFYSPIPPPQLTSVLRDSFVYLALPLSLLSIYYFFFSELVGFFYHFNAALTILYYICSISPLLPGGSYLRFSRFCVSSNQNNLFYNFDFTLLYDRPPCHDIFLFPLRVMGTYFFFVFFFSLGKCLWFFTWGAW